MDSFFPSDKAFAAAGKTMVPPVSSMAVGCGGTMLAAANGPFVRFWDVRGCSSASLAGPPPPVAAPPTAVLGEFKESHAECISALQFHPYLTATLLSGDEGGLVNVFDTSVAGEADALSGSLAADSGISRMGVFGPQGACVYATSQACGLQLWNLGSGDSMLHLPALHCTFVEASVDCQFLVDCTYNEASQALSLWAGNHSGSVHQYGIQAGGLKPECILVGGHSQDVRCLAQIATPQGSVLFTGAEDGSLASWGKKPSKHSPAAEPDRLGGKPSKKHKRKHKTGRHEGPRLHGGMPY
jgi:WD40 repeat protein